MTALMPRSTTESSTVQDERIGEAEPAAAAFLARYQVGLLVTKGTANERNEEPDERPQARGHEGDGGEDDWKEDDDLRGVVGGIDGAVRPQRGRQQ